MIYFIAARELGRVKIGYTDKCPKRRLKALQIGCPTELELEATAEGGQVFEQKVHRIFSKFRLHGEWFQLDPAIEAAIRFCRDGEPEDADPREYVEREVIRQFRSKRAGNPCPAPGAGIALSAPTISGLR